MRELSQREVDVVCGQWGIPGAGVGAVAGAAGYLGHAAVRGSFDVYDFGYSVLSGAALGAIGGPVGAVRAYVMPRAAFGLGAGYGMVEHNMRR